VRGATRTSAQADALRRCDEALAAQGRSATALQRAAFDAVLRRVPALVTAPTGSGKTVAVMLPLLARLADSARDQRGRVLVVAPVRALVETLRLAVTAMITTLGADLRVAARTGDTPTKARAQLQRCPPDVLITTPESLAVLLATEARAPLAAVTDVVLDEVHLLASGKRGALLGATLRTLDAFVCALGAAAPRRLAMSATAEPLEPLRRWVDARAEVLREPARAASLTLLAPVMDAAFPAASWAWRAALPALARAVAAEPGATLVFASSRARAERWSMALRDVLPARIGVGCYHGSLSAEERARVADGLRDGALRVVVSTSALELGVDLPRVTRVILLGAPPSLLRATQAAGRADHRPGVPATAAVLPLSALDLLRACAARDALARGEADEVALAHGDLDVAAQAALGRVALGPCADHTLASDLRAAPAFADLTDRDLDDVMEFLRTGGDAFAAYPEMSRVACADGHLALASRRSLVRYLRGVGTIVSDLTTTVMHGAAVLGELQGRFAATLDIGDCFALAGQVWRVTGRAAQTVFVRPDRARDRAVPAWEGGGASMSARVMASLERLWGELDAILDARDPEAAAAARLAVPPACAAPVLALLRAQRVDGALPSPGSFVVELIADGDALHVVAHTFAGRGANEVIARAVACRARGEAGAEVFASDESAGVTLAWRDAPPAPATIRQWLSPDALRETLAASLEEGSIGAAAFREVARVAQLWLPDARKGAVTPSLLYDVLRRHDPDHVLLRAQRHTLWTSLEGPRAEAVLTHLATRRWSVRVSDSPSPLAVPAMVAMRRDALAPSDIEGALLDAANALYRRSLEARGGP
jgi:ATP-dependent Lhr-like helicase